MCSVLVPCFDVIVVFKLYLGCAITFGERKPYVDLNDPSHIWWQRRDSSATVVRRDPVQVIS